MTWVKWLKTMSLGLKLSNRTIVPQYHPLRVHKHDNVHLSRTNSLIASSALNEPVPATRFSPTGPRAPLECCNLHSLA